LAESYRGKLAIWTQETTWLQVIGVHCGACGTSYLNDSSENFRGKCCKTIQNESCRELQPLIPEVLNVLKSLPNFGRQLHGYDNRISFGATGVENAKGGKFKNKGPVFCVRLYRSESKDVLGS
jgi:hypothetical protein